MREYELSGEFKDNQPQPVRLCSDIEQHLEDKKHHVTQPISGYDHVLRDVPILKRKARGQSHHHQTQIAAPHQH